MTSPDERTTITLDYLKGKRRAEKALGFLTDIGPRLLACNTRDQVSRTIADHIIRLNIAVCLLEYQPHVGAPVMVATQMRNFAHEAAGEDALVSQSREAAASLAKPNALPLEQSDTTIDIAGTKLFLRQFSLNHPSSGTGSLSVGRIATDFTSAELALLSDVGARFLTAVRYIS